ncbi:Nucleic acid-binding [Daphnia sinensis]|uniref:CST complex subunit STN1 n=1 Tax=Daphnia sinensis TaxID=1820382 RepID=A0AAD5KVT5_9CRUS|nr:Nucleic acid-binding [Daphnia sinensis]
MDEQFEDREFWDSSETKVKLHESSLSAVYHFKLWIGTVRSLKQNVSDYKTAIFGQKVIAYVDVLGTVIDKVSYGKTDIYVLDDGSGVISCHVIKHTAELERIAELRASLQTDSSIMLICNEEDDGLENLLTILEKEKSEYSVGETLHVQGKLSFYKEEWKIFANTIRVVEFEEENHRCIELHHLYKNIYKRNE